MEKKDVCYITTKLKKDYVFDAIKAAGFDVYIPYKDTNLFRRLIREFWFRLHLPKRVIFYNKRVVRDDKKIFIIYDPLITKDYLKWLREKNKNAKIYLQYVNRADTTINPNDVPEGIVKVSYDNEDCKKYNLKFIEPAYFDVYAFDGSIATKNYDVVFVGRDKGRLANILETEKKMQDVGLKTNFRICANRKFLKFKNKHYQSILDYDQYLDLVKHSKAILNIARQDQEAITFRELECVFDNVKCITTNKNIFQFELYDPTRFFLLTEDNYDKLPEFLATPFKKVDSNVLDKYRFENLVSRMYLKE